MNASSGQIYWHANEVIFAGDDILTSDDLTCQLIKISEGKTISASVTENFSAQDISSSVYSPQSKEYRRSWNTYFYGEVTDSILNPPIEEGSYYTALLTYTINGETYFNLAKESQQCDNLMPYVNRGGGTVEMGDFYFSDEMAEGTTLTNGGGWVKYSVPEPATGALALAGVALLFRRRRA